MLAFRDPGAEAMFLADDAALLRSLYEGSGLADPDAVAEYLRVFGEPGTPGQPSALTGGLNWYRATDFRVSMGPVTTPTLYVWGTDDIALGREAAEATAAHVDGPYRFEELDGVSHWVPEEVPDRLNALLLEHIQRR
jgi:pimeloyl-ACP methyl ester carboxylesterase